MESPCNKKQCCDEHAGPDRHQQLWFDDGNIVLLADNVAFKVHRSLLGRRSIVFMDLFELSQPSESGDEQMDGVPLVRLDDSPHELADVLDVIYNGPRFFRREPAKPSYFFIQSLLRLGKKYKLDIGELRAEALSYLELALPGDTQLWDAATKESPMVYEPSAFISMANLTRELGLDTLHLRALYRCAQLDTRLVIEGVPTPSGGTERLAPEDIVRYIDARARLTKKKLEIMEDVAWAWHAHPCDWKNAACATNRKTLAVRRHSKLWTFDADPLQSPEKWVKEALPATETALPATALPVTETTPLCTGCVDKLKTFIERRRIQILGKLEDYFDCNVGESGCDTSSLV